MGFPFKASKATAAGMEQLTLEFYLYLVATGNDKRRTSNRIARYDNKDGLGGPGWPSRIR